MNMDDSVVANNEVVMEKEDVRRLFSILKKYNLKDTEDRLKNEAKLTDVYAEEIKKEVKLNANITEQYSRLHEFIINSMSLHKAELKVILYPVFVYIYVHLTSLQQCEQAKDFFELFEKFQESIYKNDIMALKEVSQSGINYKNPILEVFLGNEFTVRICRSSYNYFKRSFLDDKAVGELAALIEEKLKIDIYEGLPRKESDIDMKRGAVFGESTNDKNDKPILYGNLRDPQLENSIRRRSEYPNDYADEATKKRKFKKESPTKVSSFSRISTSKMDMNSPEFNRIPLPLLSSDQRLMVKSIYDEFNSLPPLRRKRRLFNEDIGRSDQLIPIDGGHVDKQKFMRDGIPLNSVMYTLSNLNVQGNVSAFNEDCTIMAVGLGSGVVHVRSLTNDSLAILKSSDDLNQLFATETSNNSKLMYQSMDSLFKDMKGHSAGVYGLAWSTDHCYLLSASFDGTIRLWSTKTWSTLARFQDGSEPLWCVDIAPIYGHYFVSGGDDRSVNLYVMETVKPLRKFIGDCFGPVNAVKFHPNINYIASGSADRAVRLFDVRSGTTVRSFSGHKGSVNCLEFSDDGRFLLSGCDMGAVNVWDLGNPNTCLMDQLHITGGRDLTGGPINSMSVCRDGAVLAVGRQAGQIDIWNLSKILKTGMSGSGAGFSENSGAVDMIADYMGEHGSDFLMCGKRHHPLDGIIDILYTKRTPVMHLKFNRRNMLCCTGVYNQI